MSSFYKNSLVKKHISPAVIPTKYYGIFVIIYFYLDQNDTHIIHVIVESNNRRKI